MTASLCEDVELLVLLEELDDEPDDELLDELVELVEELTDELTDVTGVPTFSMTKVSSKVNVTEPASMIEKTEAHRNGLLKNDFMSEFRLSER